jgi:hypothetical protein
MILFLAGIATTFGISTLVLLVIVWRAPMLSDDTI